MTFQDVAGLRQEWVRFHGRNPFVVKLNPQDMGQPPGTNIETFFPALMQLDPYASLDLFLDDTVPVGTVRFE